MGISLRPFAERCVSAWRDWAFDRKFHVSTRGTIPLERLDLDGPNAEHGIYYAPTHPKAARAVFETLPLEDFSQYTFVDLGSGKGRMLFRAAEYPFKHVIGVELAPTLNQAAQDNISRYT